VRLGFTVCRCSGGEEVALTLKLGTYQFFCPVDGHQRLGMQGTVVVH